MATIGSIDGDGGVGRIILAWTSSEGLINVGTVGCTPPEGERVVLDILACPTERAARRAFVSMYGERLTKPENRVWKAKLASRQAAVAYGMAGRHFGAPCPKGGGK